MMNYYETVLVLPEAALKTAYAHHQWLTQYLDRMGFEGDEYHFSSLTAVQLGHTTLRTLVPVSPTSQKIELDASSINGVKIITRICTRKVSRDRNHGTARYSKPVDSASYIEGMLLKNAGLSGRVQECIERRLTFGKRASSAEKVDVADVLFEGEVVDADLFAQAMANGVGKKRHFGCGYLILIEG